MVDAPKIAIIGAGLAGLSCAYHLEKAGLAPTIYEKNAEVGGRIQTDPFQGFLLDRGFQVLLSNYPEVNCLFDPSELKLNPTPSGANIFFEGQWHLLENPLQNPAFLYHSKDLPFIQGSDFFKVAKLYGMIWTTHFAHCQSLSTLDFLKQGGLSSPFIEAFWRPFFGGVFLDLELQTRAQVFAKLTNYFTVGTACLPQAGMQSIPQLLRQKLKTTRLVTQNGVQAVEDNRLILESGEVAQADWIVLATSWMQAAQLISPVPPAKTRSVTCLYFSLPAEKGVYSPYLHLNGTHQGPINNLLFNSLTQPSYAPAHKILASVSVIDPLWQTHSNLLEAVTDQLGQWFPSSSQKWTHLRTYRLLHALPDQSIPSPFEGQRQLTRYPFLFLCGELVDDPSINGALYSGKCTAKEITSLLS